MPRVLTLGSLAAAALGGVAGLAPLPSAAADYDIDCAVILCMAAGFPSESSGTCSDAYDYMIDRITDRPPEPPFDTCTMSDGSAYGAAEVAFARPSRQSRVGWICLEPAPMAFDETADYTFATPSCYPDAEYIPSVFEGGTWFLGAPVAAERIAYRFQITIPTGAGSEPYVSPVFLSNPDTGFLLTLTPEELTQIAEQPTITLEGAP
ncbi:hypothetical protein HNP73_004542 [Amaricoccus macauensis]|uniref:Uncharacterized protein n=1 Tax=Amaricoccus macauensis TaxID=57001 RepID=A0A840SZQ5_9RHOB|nr:hypothetical protein [Amaricoccus macauensis]MBB5224571.1 hypothetical protein [Amaricoccus macauensis]